MLGFYEEESYRGGTNVHVYSTEIINEDGKTLIDLIARWGLVACELDGVDDAGRQKLRLMTPAELVARASETTKLIREELMKNNYITKIPAPKPPSPKEQKELANRV